MIARMGDGLYYTALASVDYFTRGGEPEGRWYSAGAKLLGLSGVVHESDLKSVLDGFLPDGKAAVQNAGTDTRRVGWQTLTAAPKTFSTAWSQADSDSGAVFLGCHEKATHLFVDYLQETAVYSRRGKGGSKLERALAVVPIFQHHTSRPVNGFSAPHIHGHALFPNLGIRSDGTTGALHSKPLYQHVPVARAIYLQALSYYARHELHLDSVRVRNHFELVGVDPGLVDAFSARTRQVEGALHSHGLSSFKAKEIANVETKEEKITTHLPLVELLGTWKQWGRAHGWSTDQLKSLFGFNVDHLHSPRAEKRALANALDDVLSDRSHFTVRDYVKCAFQNALGKNIEPGRLLQSARSELQSNDRVVYLGVHEGYQHFTTREVLREERALEQLATRIARAGRFEVPGGVVRRVLKTRNLSPEQTAAVKTLTSPSGLAALTGVAGSGKTTTVEAAARAWEHSDYRVIGVALAGRAARELAQKTGIPTSTVAKFLHEHQRGGFKIFESAKKRAAGEFRDEIHPTVTAWQHATHQISGRQQRFLDWQTDRAKRYGLDDRTVLIVDEAALLDTRTTKRLLELVAKHRSKVVQLGDDGQLTSIGRGAPFSRIAEVADGVSRLTHNHRQPKWAAEAAEHVREGRAHVAFLAYAERGLVNVLPSRDSAAAALVRDWANVHADDPTGSVILAYTRADVARLNELAQARRIQFLEPDFVKVDGVPIHVGDHVVFTETRTKLDIDNGDRGAVVECSRFWETVTVRLHDGRTRTVRLAEYDSVALGYATTTHKVQGADVDAVYVLADGRHQDKELTYTQLTRAKGETHLYVDRHELGADGRDLELAVQRSRAQSNALDVAQAHEPSLSGAR